MEDIMRSLLLAPVLAFASLTLGCAQAQLSVSAQTTDALALSAEEAAAEEGSEPGDVSPQLLLHVLRTEAHANGDDDGVGTGWTVVSDAARDVDLIALSGSPDEIADGPVPAGKLTQLRLVLDPEHPATLVVDGTETAVAVPSGATSGLKLSASPPVDLAPDDEVSVTVKVDGIVERAAGALTLSPVLQLIVDE
jgi:hypothetical protein